jgi:hypothetical protein
LGNETFAGDLTSARGKIVIKSIVFRSARVFDGESEALRVGVNVFVQGGVISEISERPAGADEEVVDCGGRCPCSCLCGGVEHRPRCAVADVLSGALRGTVFAYEPGSRVHDAARCRRRGYWPGVGHQAAVSSRKPAAMATSVPETTRLRWDIIAVVPTTPPSWR